MRFGSQTTPPIAPPSGKPTMRGLPRHPRRERLDFVERHVRMKARAALAGSSRDVVLHAVSRSGLSPVHCPSWWEPKLPGPASAFEDLAQAGIELRNSAAMSNWICAMRNGLRSSRGAMRGKSVVRRAWRPWPSAFGPFVFATYARPHSTAVECLYVRIVTLGPTTTTARLFKL